MKRRVQSTFSLLGILFTGIVIYELIIDVFDDHTYPPIIVSGGSATWYYDEISDSKKLKTGTYKYHRVFSDDYGGCSGYNHLHKNFFGAGTHKAKLGKWPFRINVLGENLFVPGKIGEQDIRLEFYTGSAGQKASYFLVAGDTRCKLIDGGDVKIVPYEFGFLFGERITRKTKSATRDRFKIWTCENGDCEKKD